MRSLLLSATMMPCIAGDEPTSAPAAPPLDYGVERTSVDRALAAHPLDLRSDPAAAEAVAYVTRQMRTLSDSPSFMPSAPSQQQHSPKDSRS